MTAEQALQLIQSRDYMFSAQASGEPAAILDKLQYLKKRELEIRLLIPVFP